MKIRIKKIPQQLDINNQLNAAHWHENGGMLFSLGGDMQSNGADFTDYKLGHTYNVDEKEVERLKKLGYEFTVIG